MEANNVKAMREALEFIKLASDDWEIYSHTIAGALDVIYEKACTALAAPPRNCDVGTTEEQLERFGRFCDIHDDCRNCPSLKADSCEFAWMQLPYEKGEPDGSK